MAPMTEEQERLFPPTQPEPAGRVFELGLVLGGTVSAGAYTAGALDLLVEALEAWHDGTQLHEVHVKVAGGSSGGAVCAAILGMLSSRKFTHARDARFQAGADNPLWQLWVEMLTLDELLSLSDLKPPRDADAGSGATHATDVQHAPSLLNSKIIDEGANELVAFANRATAATRGYFAAPFRIAVTVTNLRGIPFLMEVPATAAGSVGASFMQHDDHAWFAFPNGKPVSDKRPDEFWLNAGEGGFADSVGLDQLALYATASGALPIGLAARTLSRPLDHYKWRPTVFARDLGFDVLWPRPNWAQLPEGETDYYRFSAVDGGTLNNDPVRLVHRALAGLVGKNDQTPHGARRAMLMIDPLASQPATLPPTGTSLVSVLGRIFPTFVQGARYLTADMELFGDKDVFSRFQLVPNRPDPERKMLVGEPALAGSSLQALAGFADRRARVHDYLLGRKNMFDYLDKDMILQADNTLFDGWKKKKDRADYARDRAGNRVDMTLMRAKDYFLPILPVRPEVGKVFGQWPDWPKGVLAPGDFETRIRDRARMVLSQIVNDNLHGGLHWLVNGIVAPAIADYIANAAVAGWTKELTDTGLLKP